MKKTAISLILVFAAAFCVLLSGCGGNKEEGKVNNYIKDNTSFSTQINNLKSLYGDAMDVKSYGKGKDLVIELNVNASIGDSLKDSDLSGVEESLRPYLLSLRDATENNDSNIIYLVKDKDGKEIVNKTIS